MKALMSDRRARAEYLSAYGPSSGLTVYEQMEEWMKEALYEVRMVVLAETESPEPYGLVNGSPTVYGIDRPWQGQERLALKEALAAFVESEG